MSLAATVLQNIRTENNANLDRMEYRASEYGAIAEHIRQTRGNSAIWSSRQIAKIKESIDRTIEMPVWNFKDVVLGNQRSCLVQPDPNTTALLNLTFGTIVFGFTMTPSQYGNNEVDYAEDFEKKMRFALLKVASTLDTLGINNLEANKNQVWTGVDPEYYTVTGDAIQVTDSDKEDYYNNLSSIMKTLDFHSGMFNVVSNYQHAPIVSRLLAQGPGNDINQSFQFSPYNWSFTNRLANDSGVRSTAYTMPDGVLGFETRIDRDARMRSRVGDVKKWDPQNLPILNTPYDIDAALYYYADCSDQSALAGNGSGTRAKVEGFEFSFDYVFGTVYNSDIANRANPIVKTEITTA